MARTKEQDDVLTPADLTKEQKAFVKSMAEEELRLAAQRIRESLPIADFNEMVHTLVGRALAYLPAAFMSRAIKDLDKVENQGMMRHALRHEAVAMLGGKKSPVADRAIRRPSAPRGDDVFRLNLTLSHDLDAAINDVGYRARATGGARLAKTEVIRAACRLLLELKPDLTGVKSEDELLERLRTAAGLGGKGKG